MSAHPNDIELELTQYDLYPPLLGTRAVVGFEVPTFPGDPYDFDFILNGNFGEVLGVTLTAGINGGTLLFERNFLNGYQGSWPARFEIRAWSLGRQAGSAMLLVHDTRSLRVQRLQAQVSPNPLNVPVGRDILVQVHPHFFDANDIRLPVDEVIWDLLLPDPVPGVTREGTMLRVSPLAQAGEVKLAVRTVAALEADVVLTLLPAQDIGLRVDPPDLYPPCNNAYAGVIQITSNEPIDGQISLSMELNGEGGVFPGLTLLSFEGTWLIYIEQAFIANYQGAWPVEVALTAVRQGQLVGFASAWLHDTRTMVCTRIEISFRPGDRVQIPQEGEVQVIAAPSFYDANDIRLPHTELDWDAEVVDPMEGVGVDKHILHVSPTARPGFYRIAIFLRDGLRRTNVLELYQATTAGMS